VVSNITKEHLSTEYATIQKAVTDLSAKIDNLQAQEQKLSTQFTSTSNAIGKYPSKSVAASSDHKSNVVVFGVEECPQSTQRSARIVRDTKEVSKIFSSIDVHIEPMDWANSNLSKLDPDQILVKLHRAIDAATILANQSSLKSPLFITPDLSPAERAIESILLKERWSPIQDGYSRKLIELNSQRSCIYVNNQLYGKVINSQLQRSTQSFPLSTSISHPQQLEQHLLINLDSPNPDPSQSTTQANTDNHVCLINIRSIVNKLSIFQSYVYSRSPDVIGVTETWSSNKIYDHEILSSNYSLIRGSHGGGVMLAVHNPISFKVLPSPSCL